MNSLRLWQPFSMLREFENAIGVCCANDACCADERKLPLAPRADIAETDKGYEISLELSGVDRKDIALEAGGGVLTVSGEKRFEEKGNCITVERSYGKFSRSFRLPEDTDEKAVKAEYKNGILKVSVPKTETGEGKPLKIEVN